MDLELGLENKIGLIAVGGQLFKKDVYCWVSLRSTQPTQIYFLMQPMLRI